MAEHEAARQPRVTGRARCVRGGRLAGPTTLHALRDDWFIIAGVLDRFTQGSETTVLQQRVALRGRPHARPTPCNAIHAPIAIRSLLLLAPACLVHCKENKAQRQCTCLCVRVYVCVTHLRPLPASCHSDEAIAQVLERGVVAHHQHLHARPYRVRAGWTGGWAGGRVAGCVEGGRAVRYQRPERQS